MIISEHLCGVAIAYNDNSGKRSKAKFRPDPGEARPQGSLISYQKRQVSDACEWIRTHCVYRPRIFVCTTSPNWGAGIYQPNISQFTHTLRNGYGCENYIWVREFTKSGFPHYHFIADIDRIADPVGLSLYWSGLFGYHSRNAVRLGTKPDGNGRRKYVLDSPKMAFYMSKYLGKDLRKTVFKNSWHSAKMPGRSFGMSQQTGAQSAPIKFEVNYHFQETGQTVDAWVPSRAGVLGHIVQVPAPAVCIGSSYQNELGEYFNKSKYKWKKAKEHNVWFGRRK